MEHLVINMIENLMQRKQQEMERIRTFNKEEDKDLLLIASGKIFELDFLVRSLNELINYYDSTKKISE